MDAGGKDGVLRDVFTGINPAGVTWRRSARPTRRSSPTTLSGGCTRHTPAKGQIGVFNRSHYEDVLVVRVKGLVPRRGVAQAVRRTSATSSNSWSTRARRS